jgi:hypothetical protein
MVDFNAMLNRKYDILQQNADANSLEADAKLLSARAGAGLAASGAAENYAKAGNINADTRAFSGSPPIERTSGPLVDVGAGKAIDAAAAKAKPEKQSSLLDDENSPMRRPLFASKGMTKVPGKGSPKVDKVPAMLAPGEAVLNAPAAKMMGRGLIKKVNAAGQKKMGMA